MTNTLFTSNTGQRRDDAEVKFDLQPGREGPAVPGETAVTVTAQPTDWTKRAGQPDAKWDEQVLAETPGSWIRK